MNYIFILLFIIGLGFGADYFEPDFQSLSRHQGSPEPFNSPSTLRLVGIMAQFPIEDPDSSKTSGNGQFLSGDVTEYINFFESEILRCEGFLVDKPPHDSHYFQKQLEAVGNYYEKISKGKLNYTAKIIENPDSTNGYYTVSNAMEYYAKGDALLAEFFSEALDSAKLDLDAYFEGKDFAPDEVVFVVFHAGLSQDFAYPSLDPTMYDFNSAYIDTMMMKDLVPTNVLQGGNSYDIKTGVLLPETQNIIYYNVVEDIFGNPDYDTYDLCDIQVGMTGIFAMLLGYELGLPPMFNTVTGDPGIGFFGLMDHGSNNGRGVIPAPPTPWTRIKAGWSDVQVIDPYDGLDTILTIPALDIAHQVYQIKIAEDEYFLLENRNNWIDFEMDIDTLRHRHKIYDLQSGDSLMGNWFDSVTNDKEKFIIDNLIKIDPETQVITGFDHYDYGLPGSGILIWHINEPEKADINIGVNSDLNNRHIQIEEADGAQDIGTRSYAFFASDDPTTGTHWDMWFYGNEGYEHANPGMDEKIIFDNWSSPNTRTTAGAESFLSMKILPSDTIVTDIDDTTFISISDLMYMHITFNHVADDDIEIVNLSDESIHYLGNSVYNETAFVFYGKGGNIYRNSDENGEESVGVYDAENAKFIFTYGNTFHVTDNQYFCFETLENMHEEYISPRGYILEYDILDTAHVALASSDSSISFGDIDFDGLDEIITIEYGEIIVRNSNGTLVNGFPVNGNFSGVPLIANILEDSKPEIICREEDNIVILSNRGKVLRQFSSFDTDQPLAMVPYWDGKMALVDGSRLFLFELDMDHSYWLNPRSRPSGFPMSTGTHTTKFNPNLGIQKAYNYPNPITEGHTTFRFFVGSSAGNIQVRIYDAAGFLVKDDLELKNGDVIVNEFNEIPWNNIQIDAGLYLAEVKRDVGKSELVRLVVIK